MPITRKKAAELIKQDMFKTLYDFESYEPIETKIDSAFTSIYTDSIIKSHAYIARAFLDDARENLDKAKDARKTMEIWRDGYTSLSRSKYQEANSDYQDRMEKIDKYMEIVNVHMDSIKLLSSNFKSEFYGWKATHKFRCKTKGGNFDLGNYIYVFDKKMKSIIYKEDLDDNDNAKISGLIYESISSDKVNEKTDINASATEDAVADSISKALKENI